MPELIALGEESQLFIPIPFKSGIRLKPFASITTEQNKWHPSDSLAADA